MSSEKKRELTELQKAFLDALAGGAKGDIRKAMSMAGYSPNVQFKDVIPPLAEEIKKIAENMLAANAVKAVAGIVGVLDDPKAIGAKNAIAAAKELLDRVGLHKKDNGPSEIRADNIFILPPKEKPIDSGEGEG